VTYTSQDPLFEWAFGSYASPNPITEALTGPYAMKEGGKKTMGWAVVGYIALLLADISPSSTPDDIKLSGANERYQTNS